MAKHCFRVIDMTFPYGADASKGPRYVCFVMQLPTQSAWGHIWRGHGSYPAERDFFRHVVAVPLCVGVVFPPRGTVPQFWEHALRHATDRDHAAKKNQTPDMSSPMFAAVAYVEPSVEKFKPL